MLLKLVSQPTLSLTWSFFSISTLAPYHIAGLHTTSSTTHRSSDREQLLWSSFSHLKKFLYAFHYNKDGFGKEAFFQI